MQTHSSNSSFNLNNSSYFGRRIRDKIQVVKGPNIKGSEKKRVELNLNQNNLVLDLQPNEKKSLQDKFVSKSPKQLDH